jgi:hypothetical protein
MPTSAHVLQPNTPIKRFEYVAKTYGEKHPDVVLEAFFILADTVGIERPEREFEFARRYDFLARAPREDVAKELLAEALVELQDDPRMTRGREADALWPWLARELVKLKKRGAPWREYSEEVGGKGPALALWQTQNRIDLGRWQLPQVLEALEDFEVEGQDDIPQGEVVYEFGDGWTVQQLETEDQLDAEGEAMQHCVGTYCEAVESGASTIYSVRDPKGQPHATIEFDTQLGILKQVQGKQNRDPEPRYQERVDEFLASDAAPATDPHVKAVYDALEQQVDSDDIGYLVCEWIDQFSGDELEWIAAGFGHDWREAQTLHDLDVEPADLDGWPSVAWSYWGENVAGYGSHTEAEKFVRLMKIAVTMHRLDTEREASGAAREFAKQTNFSFAEERPRSSRSSWDWPWRYNEDEQAEWEPVLAEAEQWADTDLDLDDVAAWYSEFFTPGMAEAWEDVGVAPTVASALRAERVTPAQVDDAVEEGRLRNRYPNELEDVDKVLRAVGITPNRRRAR